MEPSARTIVAPASAQRAPEPCSSASRPRLRADGLELIRVGATRRGSYVATIRARRLAASPTCPHPRPQLRLVEDIEPVHHRYVECQGCWRRWPVTMRTDAWT